MILFLISVKCLFLLIAMCFCRKIRNFLNLKKKLEYMMEVSNLKKTLSSFQKASSRKLEGGKYAGGSRTSYFQMLQYSSSDSILFYYFHVFSYILFFEMLSFKNGNFCPIVHLFKISTALTFKITSV